MITIVTLPPSVYTLYCDRYQLARLERLVSKQEELLRDYRPPVHVAPLDPELKRKVRTYGQAKGTQGGCVWLGWVGLGWIGLG